MADLAGVNREGEALKDLVVMSYMVHLETIFRTVTRVSTEKKRVVRCPHFRISQFRHLRFHGLRPVLRPSVNHFKAELTRGAISWSRNGIRNGIRFDLELVEITIDVDGLAPFPSKMPQTDPRLLFQKPQTIRHHSFAVNHSTN